MSRSLLLILFFVAACGHTETRLILSADPEVLELAATIDVTITSADEVVLSQSTNVLTPGALGEIPVVPLGGDAERRFMFQGNILDAEGKILATQERELGFVESEVTREEIHFKRDAVVPVELPPPITATNDEGLEANSGDFTSIPSTQITIPVSNAKSWLVIANAQFRGQARLMIDGQEVALGSGVSSSKALRNWMTAIAVEVSDGEVMAEIEIRNDTSSDGETIRAVHTLAFAKLLAVPLNVLASNIEPDEEAYNGEAPFEIALGPEQTLLSTTIPSGTEKTLVIVSFSCRRRTGSLPEVWLEAGEERWPKDNGLVIFPVSFPMPFSLMAVVEPSDIPTELSLKAIASSEEGAMIRRPRIVTIPESAFKSFVSEEAPASETNLRTLQIAQGLSFGAGENLVLQQMVLGHNPDPVEYRFLVNDTSVQSQEVLTPQNKDTSTVGSATIESLAGRAQNLTRLRSSDLNIHYSFIGAFELF